MPEQTTIPADQVTDTQRLASAIMCLANGMDRYGLYSDHGFLDARELVRDLACPPAAPAEGLICLPADMTARVTGASVYIRKGQAARVFDLVELWDLPDVSEPIATMSGIQSRLDALKASVDALVRTMKPGTMFLDGGTADLGPFIKAVQDAKASDQGANVMVRAVAPAYPGPDAERDTWALDPDATGHRAPFAVGDLVVRSSGREGIHQIVEVSVDGDAPRHRSLRLKVEPTDVVVDRDAI